MKNIECSVNTKVFKYNVFVNIPENRLKNTLKKFLTFFLQMGLISVFATQMPSMLLNELLTCKKVQDTMLNRSWYFWWIASMAILFIM
jgi:hypothetical protein